MFSIYYQETAKRLDEQNFSFRIKSKILPVNLNDFFFNVFNAFRKGKTLFLFCARCGVTTRDTSGVSVWLPPPIISLPSSPMGIPLLPALPHRKDESQEHVMLSPWPQLIETGPTSSPTTPGKYILSIWNNRQILTSFDFHSSLFTVRINLYCLNH